MLFVAFVTAIAFANASPFNPHIFPGRGSFFEGWYWRHIDHVNNRSVAVIMGSLGEGEFTQSWAAMLYNDNGKVETEQIFPGNASVGLGPSRILPVSRDPGLVLPADFRYKSQAGFFDVVDDKAELEMQFPSWKFKGQVTGRRVPWSEKKPNGDGPESYLAHLQALLPCHYFVHSLASEATYTLESSVGKKDKQGKGFVHLETNYGQAFPSAWAWGEGVSFDGETQFVFTAGKFTIGGINAANFAFAFRSPERNLTFRSPDLNQFAMNDQACKGVLRLEAYDIMHKVVLDLSAEISTFSQPLYFPTHSGFSNHPGCVESFSAHGVVSVYGPLGNLLQKNHFPLSALEFGGKYMCGRKLDELTEIV